MLDEGDDEGTSRIVTLADARLREIEDDLIEAACTMTDLDEAQAILGIALALLREGADDDRASDLIAAVHRGINVIRNAQHGAEAA
jgi:hypothetical protein